MEAYYMCIIIITLEKAASAWNMAKGRYCFKYDSKDCTSWGLGLCGSPYSPVKGVSNNTLKNYLMYSYVRTVQFKHNNITSAKSVRTIRAINLKQTLPKLVQKHFKTRLLPASNLRYSEGGWSKPKAFQRCILKFY